MRIRSRRRRRSGLIVAAISAVAIVTPGTATADTARPAAHAVAAVSTPDHTEPPRWSWPVTPPRITQPYRAPAHAYGPGHRGIDLAATVGDGVAAPDDGVVAFAGRVVDRGVITIDHGNGVVSTLEPVEPTVLSGTIVRRGQPIAAVATGGHAPPGSLHLGARQNDTYMNPLRFLSALPRAVLLPCCLGGQDPG